MTRRVAGVAAWRLLILPAVMLVLSGCSAARHGEFAQPEPLPDPSVTRPSATPTPTARPTPTATRTPPPRPTTTAPNRKPPTSAPPPAPVNWLSRVPSFLPAPAPVPVTLAHATGRAAWAYDIPTSQKVAFLTIDDGIVKHPEALALLRKANIPVTLFLTTNAVQGSTSYFAQLQAAGAVIEDHTISHPHLPQLSYEQQKYELCHSTDLLGGWYGRRPVLFRPPYGEQNDDTLRAAWDCGLKAGLHWRETVNDGVVRYQRGDHKVHPGDIILMHFRSTYPQDFVAALVAIKNSGLTPALLEDYVRVS